MCAVGVVSKNFMGQRRILWNSRSCSFEEARRVPCRTQTETQQQKHHLSTDWHNPDPNPDLPLAPTPSMSWSQHL